MGMGPPGLELGNVIVFPPPHVPSFSILLLLLFCCAEGVSGCKQREERKETKEDRRCSFSTRARVEWKEREREIQEVSSSLFFPFLLVNAALCDKMGNHRSVLATTISTSSEEETESAAGGGVLSCSYKGGGGTSDVNTAAVCSIVVVVQWNLDFFWRRCRHI